MPCNGVAVAQATVNFDIEAHLRSSEQNRQSFADWLREQGVEVRSWWGLGRTGNLALGIGTNWVGLAFVGNEIQLSNERNSDAEAHAQALVWALSLAEQYVGQLIQAQIIETLTQYMPGGCTIEQQGPDGSLTLRVSIGG